MSARRIITKKSKDQLSKAKNDDNTVSNRDSHSAVMAMITNVNGRALVIIVLFCLVAVLLFTQGGHYKIMNTISPWKDVDLLTDEVPKEVKEYVKRNWDNIRIDQRNVNINGIQVFYRESLPGPILQESGKTILLLHGQAFKSETWMKDVPTIQTLATLGHRVIAMDLPGYGKSPKASIDDRGAFLASFISTLYPGRNPIVVSPSMSGSFSMELLVKHPEMMCGYVPVAPVHTDKYSDSELSSVQVPTMIVVGERDTGIGDVAKKQLVKIPTASKPQIIPKARHPCYLDDPDLWHRLLHNFINRLHC